MIVTTTALFYLIILSIIYILLIIYFFIFISPSEGARFLMGFPTIIVTESLSVRPTGIRFFNLDLIQSYPLSYYMRTDTKYQTSLKYKIMLKYTRVIWKYQLNYIIFVACLKAML